MKDGENIYIAIALAVSGAIVFILYDAIPTIGGVSIAQALIAGAVGGSLTALLSYFGFINQGKAKNKSDKNTLQLKGAEPFSPAYHPQNTYYLYSYIYAIHSIV